MVRAKFKCTSKEPMNEGFALRLEAVISGSLENESFFRWTPSGQLLLATVNPQAAEQIQVGQEYYIDITPA